jgi:hypothetical protein
VLVLTSDRAAYDKLRAQILDQFGNTPDPPTADRMAKDCMIFPPPAESLESLKKMADTAVGAGPTDSDWVYYQFVKGLAEYRLGHFQEAADWLRKVVDHGGEPPRTAEAYAVLAMAQCQLKLSRQAAETLAAGRQFAKEKLENYRGVNWNDRIIAQTLMSEAGGLIEPNSTGAEGGK